MSALAQLIAASLDDQAAEQMLEHLAEPFPWVDFLPTPRRREFLSSFLRLTRACASVGNFERLSIFLEAWEATATAYADPGLRPDGCDLTYLTTC